MLTLHPFLAKSDKYDRCNTLATKNLVDSAVSAGVEQFLFVRSAKAGGEGCESPLDEAHPDIVLLALMGYLNY